MAKLKAFLQSLAESVGLKSTDFDALVGASALAEIDIDDKSVEHINQNLYTRDRAMADPEIVKKMRYEAKGYVLDLVDDKVKALLPLLPEDFQKQVVAEKDTLKRIELLKTGITKIGEAGSAKTSEQVRKQEEEFRTKITELEGTVAKQKTEFEKSQKDFKTNFILKSQIFAQDIDKTFLGIKDTIADGAINNLRKKGYKLVLNEETDTISLMQEVEGIMKDVYEKDNSKLTLETALTRELTPYLVKNNNGEGGEGGGGTPPAGERKQQTTSANPTLAEMRMAAGG